MLSTKMTAFKFHRFVTKKTSSEEILVELNGSQNKYSFFQRTNKKKYLSHDFVVGHMYVCKKDTCVSYNGIQMTKNDGIIVIEKLLKDANNFTRIDVVIVAQKLFGVNSNKLIMVGNNDSNQVHLIRISDIKKYESNAILMCKKDSNVAFDCAIKIDILFEQFGEIIKQLKNDTPTDDVSSSVLRAMDKIGLVDPSYFAMRTIIDDNRSRILRTMNDFVQGKERTITLPTKEMWDSYAKILPKNMVPVQFVCLNWVPRRNFAKINCGKIRDTNFILGINVYDNVPIYYRTIPWDDGEEGDPTDWIMQKKCDNYRDRNEVVTKMFLDPQRVFERYYSDEYGAHAAYLTETIYHTDDSVFFGQYVRNLENCINLEKGEMHNMTKMMFKPSDFFGMKTLDFDILDVAANVQKVIHRDHRKCNAKQNPRSFDEISRYCYFPCTLNKKYATNDPIRTQYVNIYSKSVMNSKLDNSYDERRTSTVAIIKVYYGFVNVASAL